MRISYHLGVHCTDDDRLVRTLRQNAAPLAEHGIDVPAPEKYRELIRDSVIKLRGADADAELQSTILKQIADTLDAERLVLSWENFMSFPAWAVKGKLYHTGGERMRTITRVFPDCEAEFHLGLRNPATYLPELHKRQRGRAYEEFIGDTDPESLRWSDLITQIQECNPGVPVTVWADEDTPLIWPEVLRAVSGTPEDMTLEGENSLIETLMNEDGMQRMNAYVAAHLPHTVQQRRRIVSAFLDKFVRTEQVEMTFTLPGWTSEMVTRMTETYERDMAYITTMPGVTVITP